MSVSVYNKGDKIQVSKNFSLSEFNCKCSSCKKTHLDDALVCFLQKIRDHFGKPVTITSGYRCEQHNKNVGGATGSRHTKGQAADIIVSGVVPAEVAKYAESIGVKGIGLYEDKDGNFVHVDTRTSKSFWYGHAQAYRSTFGGSNKETNDGYTLKQFVMDVQAAVGAVVDGVVGEETIRKTITISAKKNQRHAAVKPVQKRLLCLGYAEVGDADGIAGVKFSSALMHFQDDNGCFVDGEAAEWGKTWHKLLELE